MRNHLSGVVLDWYDDNGATLKSKFPTPASLPDLIKEADIKPREKLEPEDFALVAIDEGHMHHKFACYDPGTTAMSVIYLMEHGEKLPEVAQKVAASNLVAACHRFGITPPTALRKTAADTLAGGNADGMNNSSFPPSQIEMGRKVEMEHTGNPQVAEEIARDHLAEFKDYYSRLDKMEETAKKEASIKDWFDPFSSTEEKMDKALAYARKQRAKGVKGYELIDEKDKKKSASMVDITGKTPAPKFKVAHSDNQEDYAVILPDGSKHYPIHTWDLMKQAEVYFQEEKGRMQPEIRRQYATKLASKASDMGYPLDPDIQDLGSCNWANQGHLKAAVEMRKVACQPNSTSRKFLDELFEKRASVTPDTYAEVLRRFDVDHGLDNGWDHVILDPWASTFGMNKVADVVWEDGADRVTSDQLANLAQTHQKRLCGVLTEDVIKEFVKDPVGIFESMPLPQKKLIARLSTDHPEHSELAQSSI
jgi:hypothetical protein